MRNLTKYLMALWLTAGLIIAPLQAMSAGMPMAGTEAVPCGKNMAAEAESRSGAHNSHHVSQESAASHCPSCPHQGCQQGDGCSSQGCVSFQLQPAAIAGFQLHPGNDSDSGIILQPTSFVSRTDPPLLRPPA